MKEDNQKVFKKLTLSFLLNPVPFKGEDYEKGPGNYKTSSEKLFYNWCITWPSFMMQYRTVFDLFQITSANLCKPIHDIINYSTFTCPFESEKCGKEGKELQ